MKSRLRHRNKRKRSISKIWIAIVVVFFAVGFLFIFPKKVHEIEILEKIKNQAIVFSEQIQNSISNSNVVNEPTIIDVTYLEKGKDFEHSHLFKTVYDSTKHWEECTVCGEKKNEKVHTYTRNWASTIVAQCHKDNHYTDTCSCGYSYTAHKPCVWDGKSLLQYYTGFVHVKKCKVCQDAINYSFYVNTYGNGTLYEGILGGERCYKANGAIIDCNHLGRCVKCGYNYSATQHRLQVNEEDNKIKCVICQNEYGIVKHTITNNSKAPATYTVVTNLQLKNGAKYKSTSGLRTVGNPFQTTNTRLTSGSVGGTNIILTSTATFKAAWKAEYICYTNIDINVGGGTSNIQDNFYISPDPIKPVITSITMENSEELTEWSRTKPIVIKGTENYCNTVKVKILDDEEKVVFEGETTVTNGQYSISCTPEIEAGLKGRKFKAIVTDACNNSIEKNFIIERIDTIAPTIMTPDEVGGEWAKSKNFTFSATDKGIGNVSIAFNDTKDYALATKDGENYTRTYKFIGDAYTPRTAIVIYKDELGNISTKDIVIDKIDNTAPTIQFTSIDRNIITVNANDKHSTLGEGSGVVSYRYLISDNKIENPVITEENSILVSDKTTGEGTFTIDNLYNNQYVYVAAVDLVGNIGEAQEIFEPISYTIKYNGNGATSGKVEDSIHKYDESKNLNLDEYERNYLITYNHNYEGSKNKEENVKYKFKNWNTKEDGTGTSYEDREEVINLTNKAGEVINLYAMWETDSISYEPTREGYSFGGWYLDAECTKKVANVEYIPTEDVTLYAKWDKEYTITVDNDRDGHTYNSYQIFKGDYYEKEEKILDKDGNPVLDENGEEKVVKIPILSNIEWGEELQKEIEEGKTHGDKIIELLKASENDKDEEEKLYTDCKTAEDVAKVLQGMPNDGDVIRNFTDVVGKYILDNNIEITKGTYTLVEEKDEAGNVIDENYKIQYLKPGYYLVIDAKANDKDDAYSRYLIDVVQDVTMEPKSSKPTLSKKVKGNNLKTLVKGTGTSEENSAQYIEDEKRNTATYKVASETYNEKDYDIQFELKSNIPDPDGYGTYKFEIVDILAKGFDYDRDSVKVLLGENEYPKQREKVIKGNEENGEDNKTETVENYTIKDVVISAENYAEYKNYFEEEGKQYLEGYAESQYGKTLILIEINDLIGQIKDEVVTPGQDVIVRYNAKLNEKCEVGATPNINEAYLKYSNNPYHNDKITETTLQTTYTYTIDLNLSKISEMTLKENNNSIENQNTVEDSEVQEQLKYLSGAEFEIYDEPKTVKDRKIIATITTDKSGQALYSSLGVGTYYLKETKSPEGYNKLKQEIEIEITATCDELGTITWNVIDKSKNDLVLAQMGTKEYGEGENKISIPIVKLQVENKSGFQLPVTGGTGTLIFTVVGLIIMLITIKLNQKIE